MNIIKKSVLALAGACGGNPCPGIEIEPGVWSGCTGDGGDCPTCGK